MGEASQSRGGKAAGSVARALAVGAAAVLLAPALTLGFVGVAAWRRLTGLLAARSVASRSDRAARRRADARRQPVVPRKAPPSGRAGGRRRLAWAVLAVSMLLGFLGARAMGVELDKSRWQASRGMPIEVPYLPPPAVLKVLSLGHQSFMADMVYIQAHVYYLDHLFSDRAFDFFDLYFDTLVALDPDNRDVYRWAARGVMRSRHPGHEPVEKAIEYARRGIERFPDDWRLYFMIGFNYRVEWPTQDAAEKAKMREKATPYLRVAAALPGSELDPNYIAKLLTDQNEDELALLHIGMGYWEASEEERRSLRGYMVSLGERAAAEHMRRVEERWLKEFPYMKPTLYELLGTRGDVVETSWAQLGVAEEQGGAP